MYDIFPQVDLPGFFRIVDVIILLTEKRLLIFWALFYSQTTEEDTVFVFIGITMFLAMGSNLSGIHYATLSNFPVYAVLVTL